MPRYTTWKVEMPVIGNVVLDFDFGDIRFRREKDKNVAVLFITGPQQEVMDLALAKLTRVLDKLAVIYDEGLIATKRGARAEYVSGPRVGRRDKSGRVFVVDSSVNFAVELLKDERHRNNEVAKLLSKPTDEIVVERLLGFYNKGLRGVDSDPFDAFLSFWGCIETILRKAVGRDVTQTDFIKFLATFNVPKKEAMNLWGRYRSAIAHAGYDPSSLKEISRVSSKLPRIKELAKRSIVKFLSQ